MALVEAPRRNVLQEDPQPEPRRQPLLGTLEQRSTDATAQEIRTDIEMLHHVSLHGDEATDLSVRLGDEHGLIAQDDVAMKENVSSSVWMFGRNVSVALEARKSRAIGSASSPPAGRIRSHSSTRGVCPGASTKARGYGGRARRFGTHYLPPVRHLRDGRGHGPHYDRL